MSAFHPPLRPTPSNGFPAMTPRTITPHGTRAVDVPALPFPLTDAEITAQVRVALQEDQAFNDVSTLATVVSSRHVRSAIVARRDGVIAGVPLAVEAFRQLDSAVTIRVEAYDGTHVKAGDIVMHISGHARGKKFLRQSDAQTLERLRQIAVVIFCGPLKAGGVTRIVAGHDIEQQTEIFGGTRHRPRLIEAGGKRDHAPARHAAVGGLDARKAAERCRLPD
jgi:hypothetical protein